MYICNAATARPGAQECYDDAMNAADEHGVIHPDDCEQETGGSSSAPSRTSVDRKEVEASIAPAGTHPGLGGAGGCSAGGTEDRAEGIEAAGLESDRPSRWEALGVFHELCEVARPEIAAGVVVAGACKVGTTRAHAWVVHAPKFLP